MTFDHLARLAAEYRVVLASGSPRRFDLLTETGIEFERIVPDLEEAREPGEPVFDYAHRLAIDKALKVSAELEDDRIAVGCDTIVVLGERLLEKPSDEKHAFEILMTLAGHQHIVCTALALAKGTRKVVSGYDTTKVFFNPVTPDQVKDYIATGEPMDKAGAYGIQGMGAFLVDRIEGNLDTVIGLPRKLLDTLARDALLNLREG
jgi:septum formation protein